MKKTYIIAALCLAAQTATAQPKLRPDNIDEVLRAMTLEEKAQLLVGTGNSGFSGSGAMLGHQAHLVAGAAGETAAIPRLGIPATVLSDGPAGVHIDPTRKGDTRTYYATGFPVGTCLASTWNPELVRSVGATMGAEALEYGVDVLLGPGMNLQRSFLCGRNFEYFSEDPLLTGIIGTAMVQGVQSKGVGVSAKHYAVNSQETVRTMVDEQLSERALRELYLRGFEMMVRRSQPWTIMASYNKVNGVYVQSNKKLLSDVLRTDWGFTGIVMTDWIGRRADLPTEQEMAADDNLMMPGYPEQVQDIIAAVKDGRLDIKDVDRNVRQMLEYIVKTPRFRGYKYTDQPDLKAAAAVTRQSATEGMVLLKNNGRLPLAAGQSVALFGVHSYNFLSGGLGSGCVNVPYVVDMRQGLKNDGLTPLDMTAQVYEPYVKWSLAKMQVDKNPEMWFLNQGQFQLPEMEVTDRFAQSAASQAQAAIVTIGRQAGEGMDREVETDFRLSPTERQMLSRVSAAFHAEGKPVVVVLNTGAVVETASWRDLVDAILVAWQPGEEGGNSVADVLTGRANPSGHLTATWPIEAGDDPATKNFPQNPPYYGLVEKLQGGYLKGFNQTKHEEGIYVGYRHFTTNARPVAYPFGFGLSYTTFSYSRPKAALNAKTGVVTIDVTVANTGRVAGKAVAQVYVAAPKGGMDKPLRELKAFGKTRELAPGESQTLRMEVPRRLLTSFDEQGHQWLGDPGVYTFQVGDNADHSLCSTTLKLAGYTEKVIE